MEHVSLRGVDIPALGLDTWPMTGTQCTEAITTALELGYRHVDTAQMYDNEDAIGTAIADSSVDRDDVLFQSEFATVSSRRKSQDDGLFGACCESTRNEVRPPRFERGTSRSTVDCSTSLS